MRTDWCLAVPVNSLVRHLDLLPDTPAVPLVTGPLAVHVLHHVHHLHHRLGRTDLLLVRVEGRGLEDLLHGLAQELPAPHDAPLAARLGQVVGGAPVRAFQNFQESSPGLNKSGYY